ncbi:MAG: hypothetical protein RLZ10_1243 [Bacteroidota bacterium]
MANSNRVFVSPGVYTSEKDLTFVAQSVGVTTLGLVGETLKGPAFEPILVSNFDEYRTYFGTTSPEKDGNGQPKYELPYLAKSYLQESNQLFVTRILGKTGYKPGTTYGIKTIGGMELSSSTSTSSSSTTMDPTDVSSSSLYAELSGKTSVDGTTITEYIETKFSGNTSSNDGDWFVLGLIDDPNPSGTEKVSPLTGKYSAENTNGKEWYNSLTNGTNSIYGYLFEYNSGTTVFDVTKYVYTATKNTDYDNYIVAALRSRGIYSGQTLNLEVEAANKVAIDSVELQNNPLAEFTLSVTGLTGGAKTFDCSLDLTSKKYITKVLGAEVYDKNHTDFPIYVYEQYPNFLKSAFEKGYVRGLSLSLVTNSEGDNFLREWDTPISPMVVSEVRGNKVDDLFEVITISDGESANTEVKVTISNINIETGEFDILVRDFYDTDDNQVVIEKFSRCSMNPDVAGYVARKVGTSDGQYSLNSKYIMLNMSENAPANAFPAGFKGFVANSAFGSSKLGNVIYKTQYFNSGDVMYYESDGTEILSGGDKVKKVTLGFSTQEGSSYDSDLLKYKGSEANGATYGFHLSTNAASIVTTGGTQIYQTTPYDLEGQTGTNSNKLTNINFRKFTFALGGGFDGWDIYRKVRTYGGEYIYGKSTYISGNTSNGGVFSTAAGNSDYYSYLEGIETFRNPEAVDINVFSTAGINWYNHESLVAAAIDMVENERADSIYIINAPGPDVLNSATEVANAMDDLAFDSNYSATYWPWIQIRDTDNATQLYVPPTGEVLKNIALTDNISYPWFAVAGYSRGIVNAIKASKKLTLDERDDLYKARVNPIATFSDTGTIIWGNKTLQIKESALDRINVRRLLLRARKLISAVAVRLLFEQNDDQVRQEFLRLVNPILESIKKERGLYDFRVSVSNDPEDIDANTLRGKIYIKPTRSLEFIDVEFVITPTGASFDNI